MTLSQTANVLLKRRDLLQPIPLAIAVGVILAALYTAYRLLVPMPYDGSARPAASLALTAYFPESPDKAQPLPLMVVGWVKGEAVQEQGAQVKLTLRRLRKDFQQSYLLDVGQGEFTIPWVHGFASIAPDEPIHVRAEAWVGQQTGQTMRLAEEVYLNTRPPLLAAGMLKLLLLASMIVLLSVFLWAFTGQKTPRKNRMAIVFSYVVIIVFLALPLLAPVILPLAFPEALEMLRKTPVGLVVTTVGPDHQALPQWALNIGGHVPKTADPSDPDVVTVKGGLIIPLYVILLSVIGGAINMTRKVPRFQEESEVTRRDGLLGKVRRALGKPRARAPAAPPSPDAADAADRPLQGTTAPEPTGELNAAGPTSKGQEDWRTGLLNQYMFLISAPFLGIATYYMLIGLEITKVPVIVLMAFSVGLISEPILRTITDTAALVLRQQPPTSAPAAGK